MDNIPIVVTRPEYRKAADSFEHRPGFAVTVTDPDEEAVARAIAARGAFAAVLGVERYTGALYEALPRGGVISRFGVGHDGIDKARATRAGLYVTNTPGVLEDAVAEHAMALILAVTKAIPAFVRDMDAGAWKPMQTTELRGKTLAVIGCGAIGRRVARAAAAGFGMRVRGYDIAPADEAELRERWGFETVGDDLDAALAEAHYVSLHIPAMETTRHFVNTAFLARLRPDAILVNTARGAIVDENALYAALRDGGLRAAALDVFETEPYEPRDSEHDLRRLPNVLMTPHVSSGTREACARVAAAALENIRNIRAKCLERVSLINREILSGDTRPPQPGDQSR